MNVLLILCMGRIAGVTAAETRRRLLRAAADVFAERGYDGTRVADIATAAGVSNGALYAHFASKAELLVDALRTHGRRLLADVFAADPDRSITDLLLVIGRCATTSASAPTGSRILSAPPRVAASLTRRCRRTRSPTSACCSRWAARW